MCGEVPHCGWRTNDPSSWGAAQAGGDFGNSTQLTRTGMRQVLRNFDQAAIAELSCRNIDDTRAADGETLNRALIQFSSQGADVTT